MKDESKTKKQLIEELTALRRQLSAFKALEADDGRTEKLLDREIIYRELAENIPGLVYRVYLREGHRMEFFNEMVKTLSGYDVSELASGDVCSIDPLILSEDRERVIAVVKKAIADHCPFAVEYRMRHKSGEVRYFMERGKPICGTDNRPLFIDGVIFDITERRRVEEALRTSEEYFKAITENASDIIFIVDRKGVITYASPSTGHILGYGPEELIGKSSLDLILPADLPRAVHDFGRAMRTREVIIPNAFRVRHKDGSERVLEGVGKNLLDNPAVAGFVMNVRDVSKSKKAEEELRESEERFRTLIELTPDLVFRVDRKGLFIYVNPMIEKVTGYAASELKGQPFTVIIAPEFRESVVERFRKGISGEKIPSYESGIMNRDGARISVEFQVSTLHDKDGKPAGRFGIGRDITERKRAEEILRESEEKYRTILESTEEGYFEVDMVGNFTFFNPALVRILGYAEEEMMGMNNRTYMDKETSRMVFNAFNKAYRTDAIMKYFDWELIRKGGARVSVETSVSLRRDSSGRPIGFRGLVRNITERKKAETELKKAFRELQDAKNMLVQSEKLSAIGRLAAGAAHEIRNPLHIMSLRLQLYEMTEALGDNAKKTVDTCKAQIERIEKIVEGLREFSRVHEKKLAQENIRELINHVLTLSAPRIKVEDVATDVRCDPDLPTVFIDRSSLEQVFFNIISNALDAMKGREERKLAIMAERKDRNILVTFSDTGHGINEGDLQKLFDPFFTTKDPDKGTGLGLSISYGIIQEHDGRIWAENNAMGGASFLIELPLPSSPAAENLPS